MLRLNEIKLPLGHSDKELELAILHNLRIKPSQLLDYTLIKRSIDARCNKNIKFIYCFDITVDDEEAVLKRHSSNHRLRKAPDIQFKYKFRASKTFPISSNQRPVVVGAGPCGYFAALLLAQMGFKPLLFERGEEVKKRTVQTFGFWKGQKIFNPESNVQFGEGGAGTFSDGKLYSQVSDPNHYGRKVLEELVLSGANSEILTLHRPHIGTFKLATVVRGLRSRIEELGGEIRFETRMDELLLEEVANNPGSNKPYRVAGLRLSDGRKIRAKNVILALGHSARDSFSMLDSIGVKLALKPFAVGLRIEHPQKLIDQARWGGMAGHRQLGHAEYKLVYHATNGRSVYSFCMCPGGLVVDSTSEKDCVVTNGMSQHSRNERNANSALVVNLEPEDMRRYQRWEGDPLAGIELQRYFEKRAFRMGGSNYSAPAQLLQDFLDCTSSSSLGCVAPSYLPGIKLVDLGESLPKEVIEAIREALPVFNKHIPGFINKDALITGVETRTSSPVRIPRDDSLESINTIGLIPAGEGAGYAGGILSAGIDGIKAAEALAKKLVNLENYL